MKWVKTAIGAVIAISVIPMIVLAVFNLTKDKVREEVVTFEVLTETTITSGTYNLIDEFVLYDTNKVISTNIKSIKINDTINTTDVYVFYKDDTELSISGSNTGNYDFILYNDDTIESDGYTIIIGDVWEITFEVTSPPVLSGVTATLLGLTSLVFASAILFSFYNFRKEGDF